MECEAEDPTWYLVTNPLIFRPSDLGHMLCEWNEFLTRRFVVVPLDGGATVPTFMGQSMNHCCGVIAWKAIEAGLERKNPVVTSAKVYQNARGWVRYVKMVKGAEETPSGNHCEPLRPLRDHALAPTDTDAPRKHVEKIHCKGRV